MQKNARLILSRHRNIPFFPPFSLLAFMVFCLSFSTGLLAENWSVFHDRITDSETDWVGPHPNDVTMRTLEFRKVPPGSLMDVFKAMQDFHANRLEWTYVDFDERNRKAVQRVKEMDRVFGGAGAASLHESIVNFPPQSKDMHMLDLDGNMIVQPHMRGWADDRGIGDPSNSDFYDHHLAYWKKVIDWGADVLHRDEPASPVFSAQRYGGGFSPTGIAGFREWLAENVSAKELYEIGVEEVNTFDYAVWLRGRGAPVGDEFSDFDDPFKEYWVLYWQEVTTDFWVRMISDIKEYANDPELTVSANNTSLQMWQPYHLTFDFAISELLLETANPIHLWERSQVAKKSGKLQVFGPPKTRSQPVDESNKNELLRKVFATAYACGMIGKIPWDVYDQSPDGQSRYFAEPKTIADLSGFVRAGSWEGYGEALAFGPELPVGDAPSAFTEGGSGGVYGFVRASVEPGEPLLVHLIDWGLPKSPGAKRNFFSPPNGEKIQMYGKDENLLRTDPEPFSLVFPNGTFQSPDKLLFELIVPASYDPELHIMAEKTGDFSPLVKRVGIPVAINNGEVRLDIPQLYPWGIVEICPSILSIDHE